MLSNLSLMTEIAPGKMYLSPFSFLPQVKVHVHAAVGRGAQAD